MSNEDHIVFIFSEFQFNVFIKIFNLIGSDFKEFYVILPEKIFESINNHYLEKVTYICIQYRRSMRLVECRSLIDEVIKKVPNLHFTSFYLASDDHPIAQIILNYFTINKVFLFEDGLGSYVSYGFMNYKLGNKSVLGKIKNYLYYFPYYRTAYSCAHINADKYFAYNALCFPNRKSDIQLLTYDIKKLDDPVELNDCCIIIGQSFIEDKIIDEQSYLQVIRQTVKFILKNKGMKKFYYKSHPREQGVALFMNRLRDEGVDISILESDCTSESLLMSLWNKNILFTGFYSSTFLYLSNLVDADKNLLCIKPKHFLHLFELYDVLEKADIPVVNID